MPRPKPAEKLSKKELKRLERKKRAERERQALEEERRRVEAEEKAFAEAEEQKRLAEENYRLEELARLGEEEAFVRGLVAFEVERERVLAELARQREWQDYLSCAQHEDMTHIPNLSHLKSALRDQPAHTLADAEALFPLLDRAEAACNALNQHLLGLRLAARPLQPYVEQLEDLRERVRAGHDRLQLCLYNSVEEVLRRRQPSAGEEGRPKQAKPETFFALAGQSFAVSLWVMAFENSGVRTAPVQLPETELMVEVPKTLFNQKMVIFARRRLIADFELGGGADRYRMVQAPFVAGCYEYPAEPVQAGGWTLKRVNELEEALRPLPLRSIDNSAPIFRVYVLLPRHVFIEETDAPEAGYFDERAGGWVVRGGGQATQEPSQGGKKCFCVEVPRMGLTALFLRKDIDFPYQHFELRVAQGRGVVTLQTWRCTLRLEFAGDTVALTSSSTGWFEDMLHQPCGVVEFLHRLSLHNVVLPYALAELAPHLRFAPKLTALQAKAVPELVRLSRRFCVQLSWWSKDCETHQLIVRAKLDRPELERVHGDRPQDWTTLALYPHKVEALAALESDERFSFARSEGTVSHLTCALLVAAHPRVFGAEEYAEQFGPEEHLQMEAMARLLSAVNLVALTASAKPA